MALMVCEPSEIRRPTDILQASKKARLNLNRHGHYARERHDGSQPEKLALLHETSSNKKPAYLAGFLAFAFFSGLGGGAKATALSVEKNGTGHGDSPSRCGACRI